jgi:hypothetical protein
MVVLAERDWLARRAAHEARVRRWTDPHQERQSRGEKHPVLDFMFSYYSHRPSRLRRWHPGPGVELAGPAAAGYLRWPAYTSTGDGVALDLAALPGPRRETVHFVHDLLTATAARTPRLGCFGMHEWAMVYRAGEVRHENWPLRLGPAATDRVVESLPLRCSHFDAYRFFTPDARPLNTLRPTRTRQVELEQPGCLHVTMDLFKWAYKLSPYVASDLVADCFELAIEVRTLDMRASPYDLSALGYSPVRVETEPGRAEYRRAQSEFVRRAVPLRAKLIETCTVLLDNERVARNARHYGGPMASVRQVQVTFDCAEPERVARFWCEVLGYVVPPPPEGFATWDDFDRSLPPDLQGARFACVDPSGVGPRLFFQRVPEGKVVKNRVHLDVRVGTGLVGEERLATLEAECARLVALGAERVRLLPADGHDESCIVMQDIEGNEFCLD